MLAHFLASSGGRSGPGGALAFNGDSITAGSVVSPGLDWPQYAAPSKIRGKYNWANRALSGQTAADIVAARALGSGYGYIDDLLVDEGRIVGSSPVRNALVLFIGTNDLAIDETSGDDLIEIVDGYLTESFALGWERVVLVSSLPRVITIGSQETFDAEQAIYNAWQASLPSGDLRIAYVNARADSRLSNAADTAYYSDGIHPTVAGAMVLAELIAPAANDLIERSTT